VGYNARVCFRYPPGDVDVPHFVLFEFCIKDSFAESLDELYHIPFLTGWAVDFE
jgi:hypothetical protein